MVPLPFLSLREQARISPTVWDLPVPGKPQELPRHPAPLSVVPGSLASWPHLQLPPLDPAHTAGSVAPGLLGPEHELALPKLVGACGCHLGFHLLKPLFMGLGAAPGEERGGKGTSRKLCGTGRPSSRLCVSAGGGQEGPMWCWDLGREWAMLRSGKGVGRVAIWEGSGPRWDLGREWAALGSGKGVGRGKVLMGFLGPQWDKGGCGVREAVTS